MTQDSLAGIDELKRRIETREVRIGIVGMGYVGLPLALLFSDERFKVTGFDIDIRKVKILNESGSYIVRIPGDLIRKAQESGFRATVDYAEIADMDVVILCVPTPLDEHHEPDLSYFRDTVRSIAPHVHSGSSSFWKAQPIREQQRKLLCLFLSRGIAPVCSLATDDESPGFYVAFSPEREDPGNDSVARRDIPKVVGGCGTLPLNCLRSLCSHL